MKRYIKANTDNSWQYHYVDEDGEDWYVDVDDIVLYIRNESDLYHNRTIPIINNLARKMKAGKYDSELAIKAWQYLADDGVRQYDKEFISGRGSLFVPKNVRIEIAKELRDCYFESVEWVANEE